ncbi:proteinase-activated receptor 3 isoform X2 [Grammomys surdaster]|uniref:proteinase-activated receptor 3 isoform X2 n=1 Tax=Grammomys surdaster TaxID=491861 RepID=UPI0010A028C5|nr:proteinase-activated receptor 3 isoform X2 [Grammomys surdaster]
MEIKVFILVATRLLFLPATVCQGMKNVSDNSAKPTLTIKSFNGGPQNIFEEFPFSDIEGWTGATTTIKVECPEESISTLYVNNATMGYLRSSLSTKVIPAIYILVFAVGVPANIVTLWKLSSRTKSICLVIFHTNLAIADLLFCVTLPFKIAYHLNGNNWVFGEVMCRITTVIFYGNMYCAILILTCMGINRYLATVHPFIYRKLPKRNFALLMCGVVWVMVFLYMLPFAILKQEYHLVQPEITTCHDVHNTCKSPSPFQFYYFVSLAVFGFFVPFVVTVFCYTSLIRKLNSQDRKWQRYIKAVLLILVIFTICFAPTNTILIIHHVHHYYSNTDSLYFMYLIALCLGSLNSCLDPFLYFVMSKIVDQLTS